MTHLQHHRHRRQYTRFEAWAWSPVNLFRVALVSSYIIAIGFASMAGVAGVPIFKATGAEDFTVPWAVILAVSSLVAAIGAIDDRWRKMEMWAALGVLVCHFSYVVPIYVVGFFAGDVNRQAVAVALTQIIVLPLSRFAWLASRAGRLPAKVEL